MWVALIVVMQLKPSIVCFMLFLTILNDCFGQPPKDYVTDDRDTSVLSWSRPVPKTNLREADVMWSKRIWRLIDLRIKQN